MTTLPMADKSPDPELLRALGRLMRGLSALFWGLPCALIVCVESANTDSLREFNVLPPLIVTVWLFYGVWQLGHFQPQERIWIRSLNRAKELALVNVGLSPFLFWYNVRPGELFYIVVVGTLAVSGLLFLSALNLVLVRLGAMLPDESIRQETRYFASFNRHLVLGIILFGAILLMLPRLSLILPPPLQYLSANSVTLLWFLVFFVLLPLALTMALLWKIKEAILDSVFGGSP